MNNSKWETQDLWYPAAWWNIVLGLYVHPCKFIRVKFYMRDSDGALPFSVAIITARDNLKFLDSFVISAVFDMAY